MLTAIVYTLHRRIGGEDKIERERKNCRSEREVNILCDKMSRKYKRAECVLIEVYDVDQLVESHIVY